MTLPLPFPDIRGQGEDAVQKNLEAIQIAWPAASGNWTSYTATVSSTSVTLGTGGSNVARYQKSGRSVSAYGAITLGTGGSFTGSDVEIALPFATGAYAPQFGVVYGVETGVYRHVGVAFAAASASTFKCRFTPNGTDNSLVALGATSPFTWGDTDLLYWQISYEAAS